MYIIVVPVIILAIIFHFIFLIRDWFVKRYALKIAAELVELEGKQFTCALIARCVPEYLRRRVFDYLFKINEPEQRLVYHHQWKSRSYWKYGSVGIIFVDVNARKTHMESIK